jgi:hypothetical protein
MRPRAEPIVALSGQDFNLSGQDNNMAHDAIARGLDILY